MAVFNLCVLHAPVCVCVCVFMLTKAQQGLSQKGAVHKRDNSDSVSFCRTHFVLSIGFCIKVP